MVYGEKNSIFILSFLLLIEKTAALTCYQGNDDTFTSNTVQGTFCIFYDEYQNSDCDEFHRVLDVVNINTPQGTFCIFYDEYQNSDCDEFHRVLDVVNINTPQLDQRCGAYTNNASIFVACFCKTNNCNSIENLWKILNYSIKNSLVLPDVLTWQFIKDRNEQVSYLKCTLQNMSAPRPPPKRGIALYVCSGFNTIESNRL
ncbi:hypothetical protein DICVIV_07996 [Dictyocaulus viviparus]|uniref:Uncharacterized protein n=1 Tax=Dictyocaulus viviparus TaxID=29172 RepID=A0A0D8XU96_DICVI|nr:hypothetical protein DICVIV_07996 [Dictyocaulus viviparus]